MGRPRQKRAIIRSRSVIATLTLIGSCLLWVPTGPALANWSGPGPLNTPARLAAAGNLLLENIEVNGNTRTATATVERLLGLIPGQTITQPQLIAAVEDLRTRRAFAAVDFYTRPGSSRGAVILVLEVVERRVEVRLGTGQSDLDGWYVIPFELSLDNVLGRGEEAAARLKFGYRHAGLDLYYREGTAPRDRWRWEIAADLRSTERIYFANDVEYGHRVERNRLGFTLGRRLGAAWRLDVGLGVDVAEADSIAEVWQDNETAGAETGDELPFAALPDGVAAGVGRRERGVLTFDLTLDTRRGSRVGSPATGLWGRLRARNFSDKTNGDFTAYSADLRAYRPAPGGVLAVRLGAAGVEAEAPFYDRLYLGGLYTLRGVPSQSLSAPAGGTWLWHASLEYRAALLGEVALPSLAGALFLDVGQGGQPGEAAALNAAASSLGWGLRYRIGRAIWLGADFGIPLSDSPVDEAFHGHTALGWSF